MANLFPRTTVANVSLSRLIIGTNWVSGWSHRTPAADNLIKKTHAEGCHCNTDNVLEAYAEYGIDTIMGLFALTPWVLNSINRTREKTGKDFILIDTPNINVDDNPKARAQALESIKKSREMGAKFCFPHHSSVEQLVNKNKGTIERIDDYTKMIRDEGMIPGLSCHMPELIVYSDQNGYDIETYNQIYNCMGFLMQVEIETVASIIHNAKKPVMTIKSMAAGRTTPYVGLNFSWATIRDCDMVTVGCMNADEVYEDIEISLAALEHRFPEIGKRKSPIQNQAAFGEQ